MKNWININKRLLGVTLWLVLANISYVSHNAVSWFITLSFFIIVPGLLLLIFMGYTKIGKIYLALFSVGLSLLILILIGVIVNQMFSLGIERPLSALNLFIALDIITVALLLSSKPKLASSDKLLPFRFPNIGAEAWAVIVLSFFMPLLALFGAFRLNNDGSNILTLLLFGLIPLLYAWLIFRPKLSNIHIVVIFMAAVSILFTVSMRGQYLTGHDLQGEYYVFQLTLQNQHWDVSAFRNAYNACLSITILPTVIERITSIPSVYIYKILFQILFASALIPTYYFAKTVSNKTIALISSLIFISFPVYLEEMSMLNRQEIGFIFFALFLLSTSIPSLSRKQNNSLSLFMLLGLILSHYSSTYVTIGLLVIAKIVYWLMAVVHRYRSSSNDNDKPFVFSWRILLITLIATFLWNIQVTSTGTGIVDTLTSTIKNSLDRSGTQASDVSYSLFSSSRPSPAQVVSDYASTTLTKNPDQIQYVAGQVLPLNKVGKFLSKHGLNVEAFNTLSKKACAIIFQLLLLIGIFVLGYRLIRNRNTKSRDRYIFSLSTAALILLGIQTVLPQLSVAYGTQRLFQQLLFITSIPMVTAGLAIIPFRKYKRYKISIVGTSIIITSLFLTNLIGQLIGGYAPVLTFNNSGDDYDDYYVHGSEVDGANWFLENKGKTTALYMDDHAKLRFIGPIYSGKITPKPIKNNGQGSYVYEDSGNVATGIFDATYEGTAIDYRFNTNLEAQKNLIYSNGTAKILK